MDISISSCNTCHNGCHSVMTTNDVHSDKQDENTNINTTTEDNTSENNSFLDPNNLVGTDISGLNSDIKVILIETNLWTSFYQVVNEMIVTREGRRLFPVLKIKILGLQPNDMYKFELDFELVENNRLKYVNGEWIKSTRSDLPTVSQTYVHPDSPNYGKFWMDSYVSFSRTKITNKEDVDGNRIFLNSMFKYVPRIHVKKIHNHTKVDTLVGTFSFKETEFVAVTAYQNDSVTNLKVKFNPFAKAFLEPRHSYREVDRSRCLNKSSDGYSSINSNKNSYSTLLPRQITSHPSQIFHPPLDSLRKVSPVVDFGDFVHMGQHCSLNFLPHSRSNAYSYSHRPTCQQYALQMPFNMCQQSQYQSPSFYFNPLPLSSLPLPSSNQNCLTYQSSPTQKQPRTVNKRTKSAEVPPETPVPSKACPLNILASVAAQQSDYDKYDSK